MKPNVADKISLSILRLGIHGEGVGSWKGFTIFVDGALPGETIAAEITEVRKNFARGRLLGLEKTSPHRVKAPCPVFGRCGGCQLMHLDYPQQLEVKRDRVKDALERIGKISVDVQPCAPSPSQLSYRNKIQLPYKDGNLGLYAFNSHDLVVIDKCYIHCPLGEKAFQHVRELLKKFKPIHLRHVLIKTAVSTNQVLVTLVTDGKDDIAELGQAIKNSMPEIRGVVQNVNTVPGNIILGRENYTVAGDAYIEDLICGLVVKVSPLSFFQVNPEQAERMYEKAIELCDLQGHESVLDAYCGVGVLSLLLARHAKEAIGVEFVPEAIADAQVNASVNQITNARFLCDKAEEAISSLKKFDVAVLNPPRKGCDPHFLQQLVKQGPERIVYISCDPATLARDIGLLHEHYTPVSAFPFDMFPQTMHVETVLKLIKRTEV